jgi:hypothetical protein
LCPVWCLQIWGMASLRGMWRGFGGLERLGNGMRDKGRGERCTEGKLACERNVNLEIGQIRKRDE